MNELTVNDIQNKIINLPNRPPAMLAQDVAEIYGVKAKYVNRAVKRNQDRFPADFCFRLTEEEWSNLKCQNVTSSWGGERYAPMAFTRFGANQLSTVLKSPIAATRSVQIMRAFSALEEALGDRYDQHRQLLGVPVIKSLINSMSSLMKRMDRLELVRSVGGPRGRRGGPRPFSEEDKHEAIRLYAAGYSHRQIARMIDRSPTSVFYFIKYHAPATRSYLLEAQP